MANSSSYTQSVAPLMIWLEAAVGGDADVCIFANVVDVQVVIHHISNIGTVWGERWRCVLSLDESLWPVTTVDSTTITTLVELRR